LFFVYLFVKVVYICCRETKGCGSLCFLNIHARRGRSIVTPFFLKQITMERTKLSQHLILQIAGDDLEFTVTKLLNLSKAEVLHIVQEWYTLGQYADILQDEQGNDLEEIINNELEKLDWNSDE
jgi:hypothetical protein